MTWLNSLQKLRSKRKRIYIIPTRYGVIYYLSVISMIMIAATYANNLVFLLAFSLFSLGIMAMIQTNEQLKKIQFEQVLENTGFAKRPFNVKILVKNTSESSILGIRATIKVNKKSYSSSFSSTDQEIKSYSNGYLEIPVQLDERGHYMISQITLSSIWPVGFFYSWHPVKTQDSIFVYPTPKGQLDLPTPVAAQESSSHLYGRGGEDFSDYKTYNSGDNLKRVDWKLFARTRQMHVKIFNDGTPTSHHLEFKHIPLNGTEESLSQLSQWIVALNERGLSFSLEIGSKYFKTSQGHNHFHQCMQQLATYDLRNDQRDSQKEDQKESQKEDQKESQKENQRGVV